MRCTNVLLYETTALVHGRYHAVDQLPHQFYSVVVVLCCLNQMGYFKSTCNRHSNLHHGYTTGGEGGTNYERRRARWRHIVLDCQWQRVLNLL